MKNLLLLCLLACLTAACQERIRYTRVAKPATVARQQLPSAKVYYSVKKFVDGDTFWIDDGSATGIKIRLIGMDTPEPRNTKKKKKHPMGKLVSDYVKTYLSGKKLRFELDIKERDPYGRVLAYVFLEDGSFLNKQLLKMGYANLMTVPPNIKYVDDFVKAQTEARSNHRGLWR